LAFPINNYKKEIYQIENLLLSAYRFYMGVETSKRLSDLQTFV